MQLGLFSLSSTTLRPHHASSAGYTSASNNELFLRLKCVHSVAPCSIFTRALCTSGQRPRSSTAAICIDWLGLHLAKTDADINWTARSSLSQGGTVCYQPCATTDCMSLLGERYYVMFALRHELSVRLSVCLSSVTFLRPTHRN